MYPFAEQVLAHTADDPERRAGGLVLEVKGDFCHKVTKIPEQHDRAKDYLDAGYRYPPS